MSKAYELIMKEFQSRIICFDVFDPSPREYEIDDASTKWRQIDEMATYLRNVGSYRDDGALTKRRRINEMTTH